MVDDGGHGARRLFGLVGGRLVRRGVLPRAGHPLRIIAYALHPIGVAFDYLLFRPAHWVGHQQPFRTIFGHRGERYGER